MSDIIEILGHCQGDPCKRDSPIITKEQEQDKVTIGDKEYHKGCEPTAREQKSKRNSYT